MLLLEIILLLGCIILAARLGGIGVGLAGGVGMVIAVYIMGAVTGFYSCFCYFDYHVGYFGLVCYAASRWHGIYGEMCRKDAAQQP